MYKGGGFALCRCRCCGLARTEDERPPEQLAADYHYVGGADAGARFLRPVELLMRALRRARQKAVTRLHPTPGRVLDVGCGRGVMLAGLRAAGWIVVGTEVDEAVAHSARQALGEQIRVGDIAGMELAEAPFDVITFWHVLEHLADPAAVLKRARELLAPGGAVIVAVPNLDSWQARLSGGHWLHLDVPRHRWHFSQATLAGAGRRAGLVAAQCRHFSLEYGPFGFFQSLWSASGFGHELFTGMLRPGGRRGLWRTRAFWQQAALAGPLLGLAGASFPLEAIAALARAGGCIEMVLTEAPN